MSKKHLDETNELVHKTTGLLNFLGGDIDQHTVATSPFEDIIDTLIKNGACITINLSQNTFNHPKKYTYFKEL